MKRFIPALILVVLALVGGGAALAASLQSVPEVQKDQTIQVVNELAKLPGDTKALDEALKAKGPVTYKILLVDTVGEEDPTAYLDRVAEKWGVPAADTLYLVIYTQQNYNLRFYMGANFRTKGVTVDEMLKLTRETYFAKNRQG
ncbi:MAG TPA: hypothetical protein VK191_08375, partial [Symbiobacteriaceae bacterium]|nr:hypothetical protein [Symbiobacteriaceae bacterium]